MNLLMNTKAYTRLPHALLRVKDYGSHLAAKVGTSLLQGVDHLTQQSTGSAVASISDFTRHQGTKNAMMSVVLFNDF